MSIFITGSSGQLGKSVIKELQKKKIKFLSFSRSQCDITDLKKTKKYIYSKKPSIILNFASYNDVDQAETEPKKVMMVNVIAVKNIAICCNELNIPMLHISSDYIFDGKKFFFYNINDKASPNGIYGLSKLKGELEIKKNCKKYIIIRTSRIFSKYKNNLLHTILNFIKKKNNIKIINDQYSCPTSADFLAYAIVKIIPIIIKKNISKTYHLSNLGCCSWYEFAREVINILNIKNKKKIKLIPISASSHNLNFLKIRPRYSALNSRAFCKKFKIKNLSWKKTLQKMIKDC